MKNFKYSHLGFLTVICLLSTNQAYAGLLYGHDDLSLGNGELYEINTATQTVTLVGADAARFDSGPEIQISPDNSTIYMSQRINDPLFLIDPATGLNTGTLGLTGFPGNTNTPTALEFVGSTLYAAFHRAGSEDGGILGTIDLGTGAITSIGAMTGINRPTGGLHYVNGMLFAVSSTDHNDSRLFSVDLGSGAATVLANLTLGGTQQQGATALAFADGNMYTLLTDDSDTNLYSVNLNTGELTLEFDLGVQMNSLTAVPVPAAVWLFGTGLIGLIGIKKSTKVSV